jgi:cell wall-associated NlpC family hydrolase
MMPAWVNEYVGIPFKAMGRDRMGLGCWGMVYLVYREQFGIAVPSYSESHFTVYDSNEVGKMIANEVASNGSWVEVERSGLKVGDLVLIRVSHWPAHIGIIVDPQEQRFLHVRAGTDSCIDRLDSAMWRHRITGFYRHVR